MVTPREGSQIILLMTRRCKSLLPNMRISYKVESPFIIFNEKLEQSLRKESMSLPDRSLAPMFRLDNHCYERIRASWREARRAVKLEYRLLRRLEAALDIDDELCAISDVMAEDDCPPLRGLDIGVAGTVLTLAALGCVTVASCNGGCFGDAHHEDYPLIAFYAKPKDAVTLLAAAEETGVGVGHADSQIQVWANDIWCMHNSLKRSLGDVGRCGEGGSLSVKNWRTQLRVVRLASVYRSVGFLCNEALGCSEGITPRKRLNASRQAL